MKKITTFFILFLTFIGFSQNNPINFESGGAGANWNWTVFENGTNPPVQFIANPAPSATNNTATVMRFEALQSGQPFAGCESANSNTVGPFLWDATNRIVKVKVWKSVISDVGIKFATATGWSQGEIKVANTLVNQWEELTFNFSNQSNPPASEGQLNQIIIFPDFNARTQTNVCFIDEITFQGGSAAPGQPVGFVAFNTIGPNPVNDGEVFLACGPNNVGGNIVYRLFYALASANITNPIAQATQHTFGTVAGDGGGNNAFGFVIGGLNAGTAYNFWLYQYDTASMQYSTPATANVVSGGQSSVEQLELPVTFESSTLTYTFVDFEGAVTTKIPNPDQSGINTSANVARYTKNVGSATFAGSILELSAPIDFSNSQAIKIKTWSPTAGITVRLKLENSTNNGIFVETDAVTTVANAWEELTFVYPGVASGLYQKIIIFFNFGVSGTGESYFFDDINKAVVDVPQIQLPLDFESSVLTYSFSDFGGAVTAKVANPAPAGINTSANVARYLKTPGSATFAGSFIDVSTPIVFSNDQGIKVKTWSPAAGITVRLKLENIPNGGIFVETDATTTVANAWEELTFAFPAGSNEFRRVVIFFNFGVNGAGEEYFFDDIVKVESLNTIDIAANEIVVYPNPVKDNLYINSQTEINRVEVYNIFGQKVYQNEGQLSQVDLSNLNSGIYLVQLYNNEKVITKKIVKN